MGALLQGCPFSQRQIKQLTGIQRIEKLFGRQWPNKQDRISRANSVSDSARRWRSGYTRDVLAILTVAIGSYLTAVWFDLAEKFHTFARNIEQYELDEVMIAGLVTLIAIAFFAIRRCSRQQCELSYRDNLEQELIASRANALELIENKSAFLANLSHEFRTPLNAIHGFADMMRNEIYGPLANEKYTEYVKNIQQGSALLIELVNDVIDLERIDAGQESLAERPCCLHQTIRDILPIIEPVARHGNIRIVDNIPDGLGRITADQRAIQKIALNLLTNAVKYNRRGGSVILSAHIDDDNRYVFKIEDTGIGIAERELDKVLDPFHRGESPFVKSKEGSGLGLNIANQLIRLHDARLTLRSKPNKGTTVIVTFPPYRWLGPKGQFTEGDGPTASAA